MQQGNYINSHAAKLWGKRQKRIRRRLKIWNVRMSQIIKVNYTVLKVFKIKMCLIIEQNT